MENYEHALQNAKGWFEEIRDAYRAAGDPKLLSNEQEDIIERLREQALSVLVREPWHSPSEKMGAVEYEILLTTGGPGLRVWGELDGYGEPASADLEMQDWGVPWRKAWPWESTDEAEAKAAVMWFASLFWFGE